MPAQKASRTKNPIADINPASKAISSIASIQRMEGIFFMALICVNESSQKVDSGLLSSAFFPFDSDVDGA
jgi:hypothetical protein